MWHIQFLLLMLFFGRFKEVPAGENGDSDGDYQPPLKKLKSSCYFANPIPIPSPLEKKDSRDPRYKVSSTCNGALHSMLDLAENVDRKLFGAPHELAIPIARAEALFLDDRSDLTPWKDEVICQRHLDELSRDFYNTNFGHVKYISEAGKTGLACGYPEEKHKALQSRTRTMSYTMSQNLLHSDGLLVPVGTPLCDRHYNGIPKRSTSPRCPQFADLLFQKPEELPDSSQPQSDASQEFHDFQETEDSATGDDGDWCPDDDDGVAPNSKLESKLREFLKEANVKRAFCKKRLSDLTPKNLKAKTRTVIEILQIIVGQLTNTVEDYNRMMELVTEMMAGKTLAEENAILNSMMHAVAENFARLVKYNEKVQLLSVFASHMKYHIMAQYIPNLAERMWNEAKKRAMSPVKLTPDVHRRVRYDPVKLELFIAFITSAHVMVGIPWGEQKTKDSFGNIVILPNTIRLTGIFETIRMYETAAIQSGNVPLSNSTTYKLLSRFPAILSSSKTCVDYYAADATKGFMVIQEILKMLNSMNLLDAAETSSYKRFFDELQVYLRTDYKLHIKEESRIADHCWNYALSDPMDARFSAPPTTPHEHDRMCPMCEKMEFVFRNLGKRISDWASSPESADSELKLLNMEFDFRSSFDKIMDYKGHIVRSVFTSNERDTYIRELKEGESFITMDFAMKWIPSFYRETQKDFFGKPGLSWHISHAYAIVGGELVQHTFVHILTNEEQNGAVVVEIVKHMAKDLGKMGITKITLRSDNAGYYHSAPVLATIPEIEKATNVKIAAWSFSESQAGKSSSDRYAGYAKTIMRVYMAKGHNIDSVEQMFIALTEGNGLRGMSVHLGTVNYKKEDQPKTTIKGVSTLGHFQFDGDTISAWRFRGIGEGMVVKGLKGIVSSSKFPKNGGKVSRDGLKDEDKQKIAKKEEPFYWFFPTKKANSPLPDEPETGDVDDETVTGEMPPVANSDPSTQALFICSKCSASFIRYSNLLRHVGQHKIRPEKVTMYDFALGLFKRVLEEVQQAVGIGPLSESFKEYEEVPKDPRPMGWALPTKKKSARYNPAANKMVTDLFEERFRQNKKLRAEEAEKLMRERKDIAPADRMTYDQIKNRIRTLLAKKKEEQEKHHRNRQRRMVAQIADWIADSEEEGGVIEEEVDDIHEDDRTISSDSIYDMIHAEMMDDLFYDVSNPEFSDVGEIDQ